jgi:predicted  nucleic acid-binding Zn-ribbon protein
MWRCTSCGYVWEGDSPPDKCPKCGAAKEKFEELEAKAMETVENSRYTNDLHMNLYALLDQVAHIAEEGIDDNLDPGCVKIFKRALEQAEILQQSVKAEIQGHVGKGKWG